MWGSVRCGQGGRAKLRACESAHPGDAGVRVGRPERVHNSERRAAPGLAAACAAQPAESWPSLQRCAVQGTCARTRTQAGVCRQFVALTPMPPSRVAKRCVGRLRSSTSLDVPEALQLRRPHAAATRRRAESKARAVEFGASCTCSPDRFGELSMPSAYERALVHPLPASSLEIVRSRGAARMATAGRRPSHTQRLTSDLWARTAPELAELCRV